VQKWNENRDIAKNVPLFEPRKLKMDKKLERIFRYCKKRSTSADKTRFQGIVVSALTAAFKKNGETQIKIKIRILSGG